MGLSELIISIAQSEEAKDLKAKMGERPKYEIPEEYKALLSDAQLAAAEGLPEAQKENYVKNVLRSQEGTLQGISSRRGGLTGLAAVNQQGQDAYDKLLAADTSARMANRGAYRNALGMYGGEQEKKFLLNDLYPWMQDDAYQKQLKGAAYQNFATGISDIKNTVLGMVSPTGGQENPTTANAEQNTANSQTYTAPAYGYGSNPMIDNSSNPNYGNW